MVEILTIENSHWRIGFSPATGGSITSGQVRIGDAWVDVLRPTPEELLGEWWDTASYPLIPWSNRIRHSTLLWKGEAYQLRPWKTEDYAMHGTVVEFPWEVEDKGDDFVTLRFDARGYYGVNFPWDFVAHLEYRLEGKRLTVVTAVENVDDVAFPAGLGHHPYFLRQLRTPDGKNVGDVVTLPGQRRAGVRAGELHAHRGAQARSPRAWTSEPCGTSAPSSSTTASPDGRADRPP